jgi:tetratricopeptide (TPR) repeat protein
MVVQTKGSAKTQKAASNSLLLISGFSLEHIAQKQTHGEFYQQFVRGLIEKLGSGASLQRTADHLILAAEQSYSIRRMDDVRKAGEILLQLPAKYHCAGTYYVAISTKRQGRFSEARSLFENVFENGSPRYRAKAICSLGAIAFDSGDYQTALRLFLEASRINPSDQIADLETVVTAQRMIAVIKSIHGDHVGALNSLDRLFPAVRAVSVLKPYLFYEHLNSLAVEFVELGQLAEASRASNIAIGSRYAPAYPEWHETRSDIQVKSSRTDRSTITISRSIQATSTRTAQEKECEAETVTHLQRSPRSGSLLIFPARTQTPKPHSVPAIHQKVTARELGHMSRSEKRAMLLEQTYRQDSTADMYDKLLRAAGLVIEEEEPRQIDLESPGVLEEMMTLWMNGGVDPVEFAQVMSALRDCDDEMRRTNIMDRMITCAFRESRDSAECEETWRNRIEARLSPGARQR